MGYGERESAGSHESDGQCVCAGRAAGVDHAGDCNLTVDCPSELGSVLANTTKSGPFTVVGGIVTCIGDVGPVAILVGVVQRFEDHVEGSLLALIEGGRQTVDPREGRGLLRGRRRGRGGWVLLRRVLPVIDSGRSGWCGRVCGRGRSSRRGCRDGRFGGCSGRDGRFGRRGGRDGRVGGRCRRRRCVCGLTRYDFEVCRCGGDYSLVGFLQFDFQHV